MDIQDNFNTFHANVNGLESKFERLRTFLECSKSSMNVIAITETSENENDSFVTNVSMDGFKPPIHTPVSTSKGGVALYVDSKFDSYERVELNVQTEEFQSVWIEIK